MHEAINVFDHGYVRLVESWGRGDAGEMEAAIIEAARQSTQGAFRGWNVWHCQECGQNFDEKMDHSMSGIMVAGSMVGDVCPASKGWSNDAKLLAFMFSNDHSTPFEFAGMTIEVQAMILVFREWHRHRTQGYNEMSARYAQLPNLYYMPTMERLFMTQKSNKQAQALDGSVELTRQYAEYWLNQVEQFYEDAEALYQDGLNNGIPKELARVVMPVGHYSRMRATANLRNWIGFLMLRAQPKAQYEIRMFANATESIIREQFPYTWALFNDKRTKS